MAWNFTNITNNVTSDYTGPTTKSPAYYEYMRYLELIKDFTYPLLGITLTIICIVGMLANILNVVALSMIIKKSKLPVYRCFLGLAIADFMVSLYYLVVCLLFNIATLLTNIVLTIP